MGQSIDSISFDIRLERDKVRQDIAAIEAEFDGMISRVKSKMSGVFSGIGVPQGGGSPTYSGQTSSGGQPMHTEGGGGGASSAVAAAIITDAYISNNNTQRIVNSLSGGVNYPQIAAGPSGPSYPQIAAGPSYRQITSGLRIMGRYPDSGQPIYGSLQGVDLDNAGNGGGGGGGGG